MKTKIDRTSRMFKPDPKTLVGITFRNLFGSDHEFEVRGARQPSGLFVAELNVGDTTVCRAHNRDWRVAYKSLTFEVEKLFSDGVSLV